MTFENTCNCIVDYSVLEEAIKQECERRKIQPKDNYKIYIYRGYAGISIKHDKVSVHRIIGKYMVGFNFDKTVCVHHIDGNKLNNNISNLQIINNSLHTKQHYIVQYTSKEQILNNAKKGADSRKRKDVTSEKVNELKNKGFTIKRIAQELNCGYNTICRRLGMVL